MTTPEPASTPKPRKPRKRLKDMTPEELAEREARKDAERKEWLRQHQPHMIGTLGVFLAAIAFMTDAGSSYDAPNQAIGAEILLIFSAIPVMLIGKSGAIILFFGAAAVCLIVAIFLWARLRIEERSKPRRKPQAK